VAVDETLGGRGVRPSRAERALTQTAESDFTAFFRAEYARTVRTVCLVLHDQARAEEITQDAFVQLLRCWEKVSGYEQPAAWVRRVAIRMAVRSAKRETMRSLLEWRSRAVEEPATCEIHRGRLGHVFALLPADRHQRRRAIGAAPEFHFNEHDRASVARHEIDLAAPFADIPVDDLKALQPAKRLGDLLAAPSRPLLPHPRPARPGRPTGRNAHARHRDHPGLYSP